MISLFAGILTMIYSQEETLLLLPRDATLLGALLNENAEAILAPDCDRGECLWEISRESQIIMCKILPEVRIEPATEMNPPADVIIQLRWVKEDKNWSSWFPENLLAGGDFRDQNNSGIPDLADILEISSQTLIRSDLPDSAIPKWVNEHISLADPPLVKTVDGKLVLVVPKPREQGQTIVQMRSDRIPASRAITISGWNGWNLGEKYTMGLMSRFHEIDTNGNRLNKIMFIGDDDFNERGGVSPLKWRAVTFAPRNETRRLNLYPMRLISSPGTIMASQYQMREDRLDNSAYRGKTIRFWDLKDTSDWSAPEPSLKKPHPDGLVLLPRSISNVYILSPSFEIPPVNRIALSVEMDVTVPERYNDRDPSHKAWMSTYLEFLDRDEHVEDVLQITSCRPLWGDVLVTAGERPQGSRRARIRLVASHKTYLGGEEEKNMDGLMVCRWRNLEIFESLYPQTWRARLDEEPLKPGEIPASEKYQIRAILLSDRKTPSPILHKIKCLFETKRY